MIQKGFTLVELMVVIGILSVITLVISQPLANVIKYQRESQLNDNMRDNLQFVMNRMEKELKTSTDVTIDTTITPNKLIFTDQFGVSTGYSHSLNNDEILRTSSGNTTKLTENTVFKVTKLVFNERLYSLVDSKGLVTVSIEATSLNNKDKVSMQISVYPVN